jgi:hypothetical protein
VVGVEERVGASRLVLRRERAIGASAGSSSSVKTEAKYM